MREVVTIPPTFPTPTPLNTLNKLGLPLVAASSARHMISPFSAFRPDDQCVRGCPVGFIGVTADSSSSRRPNRNWRRWIGHEIATSSNANIGGACLAKQRESTALGDRCVAAGAACGAQQFILGG